MQRITNLVVLALIIGVAYSLWNWKFAASGDGEMKNFAERSCLDAARSRYDAKTIRTASVRTNAGGYVVRASMTLSGDRVARVTCVTNENGRVEDIFVEQR